MKNVIITSILAILVTAGTVVPAQELPEEYLGLPGDNLNLYAVMKLFQDSKTLEEFERSLNSKDSMINNLDLNRDGFVDYITVTDYVDGKVHTIVLRAVLGRDEFQDVAVFIVERKNKNRVRIQLIGDEDLYGKNYIIEPKRETPNPGYNGDIWYVDDNTVVIIGDAYYYDLYDWQMIDYMYMYDYQPWHSHWYWGYWPAWYEPWSPWYWHYYYGYHYNWYPYYHEWYHHWDHPIHHHYNDFYYGTIRAHSVQVENRIHEGNYRETYSRPELRTEGENRYATMHINDTRSADGSAVVTRPSRRPSESQLTRNSSAVSNNIPERRSSETVSTRNDNNVVETSNTEVGRRSSAPVNTTRESVDRSGNATINGRRPSQSVSEKTYERPANTKTTVSESPVMEAPAVRQSETRSSEARTSAPVEKSSNTEEAHRSIPSRR